MIKIVFFTFSILLISLLLSPYLGYFGVFKAEFAYYLSSSFSFSTMTVFFVAIYFEFILSIYTLLGH